MRSLRKSIASVDDLKAREALAQIRVVVQELPVSSFECGLDLRVGPLEQRVDRPSDLLTDLRRHVDTASPAAVRSSCHSAAWRLAC